MRRDEIPAGWTPIRCLRCGGYHAVPEGASRAERYEANRDHHLWMCPRPTPRVARMRRQAQR